LYLFIYMHCLFNVNLCLYVHVLLYPKGFLYAIKIIIIIIKFKIMTKRSLQQRYNYPVIRDILLYLHVACENDWLTTWFHYVWWYGPIQLVLTRPLRIEAPVPSQKSERSNYVLGISILHLFLRFSIRLFRTVSTLWHFVAFPFILNIDSGNVIIVFLLDFT